MTNLDFRKLTLEQIRSIYYDDMVRQFPDSERRSYANIADMIQRGIYGGYGLFDGGRICAYALAALFPEKHAVLLDYLAVPVELHGQGYGSEMLSRLRSHFGITDRILIETEDPLVLEGAVSATAQRRLGFYKRNGYRETAVRIYLFSVWYRLYVNDIGAEDENCLLEMMTEIYHEIVPPRLYTKNVHLQLREEG